MSNQSSTLIINGTEFDLNNSAVKLSIIKEWQKCLELYDTVLTNLVEEISQSVFYNGELLVPNNYNSKVLNPILLSILKQQDSSLYLTYTTLKGFLNKWEKYQELDEDLTQWNPEIFSELYKSLEEFIQFGLDNNLLERF